MESLPGGVEKPRIYIALLVRNHSTNDSPQPGHTNSLHWLQSVQGAPAVTAVLLVGLCLCPGHLYRKSCWIHTDRPQGEGDVPRAGSQNRVRWKGPLQAIQSDCPATSGERRGCLQTGLFPYSQLPAGTPAQSTGRPASGLPRGGKRRRTHGHTDTAWSPAGPTARTLTSSLKI